MPIPRSAFHVHDRNDKHPLGLIHIKHGVREDGGEVAANGLVKEPESRETPGLASRISRMRFSIWSWNPFAQFRVDALRNIQPPVRIPHPRRDGRRGLSPPHNPANAGGNLLPFHWLHGAILNLRQSAAGFLFPGFITVRIGRVQVFRQPVNKFTHLFSRPLARFGNDLFQCDRHARQANLIRVTIQARRITAPAPPERPGWWSWFPGRGCHPGLRRAAACAAFGWSRARISSPRC